jgi:hypothetical protein
MFKIRIKEHLQLFIKRMTCQSHSLLELAVQELRRVWKA